MKPFITVIDKKPVRGNKRTVFECKICGEKFGMLRKAREHVLRLHKISKGESSCDKIKTYIKLTN